MKAHELARVLLALPDFEVQFSGSTEVYENIQYSYNMHIRFDTLEVADVGYSDKVIVISGTEV